MKVALVVFLLFLIGCTSSQNVTDQEILEYAQAAYNKEEMMNQNIIIGMHNDLEVHAWFPCSDLCPEYTTRIIYYDTPKEECLNKGGIIKTYLVPVAISVQEQEFCIPQILSNYSSLT